MAPRHWQSPHCPDGAVPGWQQLSCDSTLSHGISRPVMEIGQGVYCNSKLKIYLVEPSGPRPPPSRTGFESAPGHGGHSVLPTTAPGRERLIKGHEYHQTHHWRQTHPVFFGFYIKVNHIKENVSLVYHHEQSNGGPSWEYGTSMGIYTVAPEARNR